MLNISFFTGEEVGGAVGVDVALAEAVGHEGEALGGLLGDGLGGEAGLKGFGVGEVEDGVGVADGFDRLKDRVVARGEAVVVHPLQVADPDDDLSQFTGVGVDLGTRRTAWGGRWGTWSCDDVPLATAVWNAVGVLGGGASYPACAAKRRDAGLWS